MARKKKPESSRPIESYEHKGRERLNNPPVGLVTPETDPDAGQKTCAYDPHLDPLVMSGRFSTALPLMDPGDISLRDIDRLDAQLFERFENKFVIQPSLSRQMVSFQANKTRPVYRWYKFKEAFSASLVEHLFHTLFLRKQRPFLFLSANRGGF